MTIRHHLTFNDLDHRLQELALLDFEYFCVLTKVDKRNAFVCIEKAGGKSLQQIANKLHIPKSTIRDIVKKCAEKPHSKSFVV